MSAKTYRDLEVWQKSMDLVEAIYRMSATFPKEERFGLTSQMQRAAVSIPANIAEGYARAHRGEYIQHLSIARGSLAELETHIAIVVRLQFVSRDRAAEAWKLSQAVGKMLRKLVESLKSPDPKRIPKPYTRNPKPETRTILVKDPKELT